MFALHEDSSLIVASRVFWMLCGPAALLICLAMILNAPGTGWITRADIAYWIILAMMVLARRVEFAGGYPRTSHGAPAKRGDLARYAALAIGWGAAAWAASNVVSNFVLA